VLDLELHDAALDLVDLGRHGVDLDAQARGGLVDEVDGLVGEEAVGDVAVAEGGRRDERGVLDAHLVVVLVALLEPAEDRDRVLDARLADHDGLEAALERGVLLDVLAVLVERRRADRAQLAAGEHRLEQVRGVNRALRCARAHDRVQLVHEEHDLALGVLDLGQDALQALLELAAVLRAGEQRADVQRDDTAVAQRLGHVARDDPLREPLDDRGLADAGLADEHGVVLRAAAEDLDDAANLVVAADDRVELSLLGRLREVATEALERLVALLGRLVGDAVGAADLGDRLDEAVLRRARGAERVARAGLVLGEREQEVLGGDVLVLEVAHLLLGEAQDANELGGRTGGLTAGAQRGQGLDGRVGVGAHARDVGAELLEHGRDDASVLLEQDEEQVLGRDLRVAAALGERARGRDGFLRLDREAVWLHRSSSEILVCQT
jgi:hypothetical protein